MHQAREMAYSSALSSVSLSHQLHAYQTYPKNRTVIQEYDQVIMFVKRSVTFTWFGFLLLLINKKSKIQNSHREQAV